MSDAPARTSFSTIAATVGILLLPVLCCGVPLLIGAGTLGLAGTFGIIGAAVGNPWVVAAAGALAVGVLGWFLRHRYISGAMKDACRVPSQATNTGIDGCRHPGRDA